MCSRTSDNKTFNKDGVYQLLCRCSWFRRVTSCPSSPLTLRPLFPRNKFIREAQQQPASCRWMKEAVPEDGDTPLINQDLLQTGSSVNSVVFPETAVPQRPQVTEGRVIFGKFSSFLSRQVRLVDGCPLSDFCLTRWKTQLYCESSHSDISTESDYPAAVSIGVFKPLFVSSLGFTTNVLVWSQPIQPINQPSQRFQLQCSGAHKHITDNHVSNHKKM